VYSTLLFSLLLKPTAQKMEMENSSTGSSRHALPRLLFLWCLEPSADLLCESHLVSDGYYLCNNYILFMTFSYLWTLYVRVCGINDHGHTCDEYLVLFTKLGMIANQRIDICGATT
jgi:hypothetical protein